MCSFRERIGSPGTPTRVSQVEVACDRDPASAGFAVRQRRTAPGVWSPDPRPAGCVHRPPAAGLKGCGPADANDAGSRCCLLRVELDDELFLHRQVDLLARRDGADLGRHLTGIELEPLRDAAALDLLHRVHDGGILPARLPDPDEVSRLDRERRDIDFPSVHGEMPMSYELAG